MVGSSAERTLICALLPRKSAHINGVISVAFRDGNHSVDAAGLYSSIVMDFYMKTLGASNVQSSRMNKFPLGVAPKYQSALYSRTLLLNCLTKHYADLWEEMWKEEYKQESWSIEDKRLKPFASLTEQWQWSTPLRNYFERPSIGRDRRNSSNGFRPESARLGDDLYHPIPRTAAERERYMV